MDALRFSFAITSYPIIAHTVEITSYISTSCHRFLNSENHLCTKVVFWFGFELVCNACITSQLACILFLGISNSRRPLGFWMPFPRFFKLPWESVLSPVYHLNHKLLTPPPCPTLWLINFHYWFCVKVFRVLLGLTPVVTKWLHAPAEVIYSLCFGVNMSHGACNCYNHLTLVTVKCFKHSYFKFIIVFIKNPS